MKLETKGFCPFGGVCQEIKDNAIHQCNLYVEIKGKNPNTGEDVSDWACSLAWLPMLMIENSQQQRQTGAAVESFRNAMMEGNIMTQRMMEKALTKPNDIKVISNEL